MSNCIHISMKNILWSSLKHEQTVSTRQQHQWYTRLTFDKLTSHLFMPKAYLHCPGNMVVLIRTRTRWLSILRMISVCPPCFQPLCRILKTAEIRQYDRIPPRYHGRYKNILWNKLQIVRNHKKKSIEFFLQTSFALIIRVDLHKGNLKLQFKDHFKSLLVKQWDENVTISNEGALNKWIHSLTEISSSAYILQKDSCLKWELSSNFCLSNDYPLKLKTIRIF